MLNKINLLRFLIVVLFLSTIAIAAETTWRHSGFEISGYDISGASTYNLTEIRKIEFGWNTSIPAVSETNRAVMYYDDNQKRIMQSLNGGAYQAIVTNATVNAYTVNVANATNVLPNASIPASAANLSKDNVFSGGIKANYISDNSADPATAGFVRMGHGDYVVMGRNQAGSSTRNLMDWGLAGNNILRIAGDSDIVTFPGSVGIGNTTPSNVLSFAVGSATDPIADSWLQYSTPESKIVLGEADNLTEKYRKDFRNTTVYRWKRTINEPERLGVLAQNGTPSEILAYHDGENNTNSSALNATPQGIDLGAYIGWLHEVVKGQDMQLQQQEQQIASLEARVQKLEDRGILDIMFAKQINYLYKQLNMTKP